MNGLETEVKFFVRDLRKIELRLLEMKAQLIQPRVHEINFRYDLPDGSMRTNGRVLRLRQDVNATMTFKGPSDLVDGVFSRVELETEIGDFQTACKILDALGYVKILTYEKFRAVYDQLKLLAQPLPRKTSTLSLISKTIASNRHRLRGY